MVLPEGLPEWIQLLPAGEIATRDGRGPWKNADPAAVLAAFAAWGMPLDVDYHHQSENAAEKAEPVPAAGWIHELQTRNGEIWGRVTWTERAAAMIAAREFRYISPVFNYDKKTGVVQCLVGAGLTNKPNLFIQAVAAARGGGTMNPLLKVLCTMLNLPLTTTEEEMAGHLDRVKGVLTQAEGVSAASRTMAKSLALPETAALPEIATALQARLATAPDLGQYVPRSEFERVANALNTLQTERRTEVADRLVVEAIKAGKIAPAMKEWATSYCSQDPEGFKTYVEKAPAIVSNNGHNGGKPPQPGGELDDEDRAFCSRMGIDPEEYKKTRDRK